MRNAFRAYVYDHNSPAEVLRCMRRHVADDAMATAVCLALDPYTRRLTYASAGHPPSLLLAGDCGTVSRLDAAGAPPLGCAEPAAIREAEIALPSEATVVAYTDGLIERRDWSLDVGIDLLADVLAASSSLGPEVLAARILTEVASRVASGDDIAFLVVRACGVPECMDIEIPGDPALLAGLRRRLRRWLELRGLSEQEREDAVLSISEACNNAIEHAYDGMPGAIRLMLHHRAGALEVTVEDHGSWRTPALSPERGHGIEIMRAVMHDATIQHESGRTRVLLSRRLGS
jgi:anti-sigma regulatory factor (Ser/Thr protein kinase)